MDGWMYWFGFWRHGCSRSNVALVVILEEEDSVPIICNVRPQNSDLLLEGDGDKSGLTCEHASASYLGSSDSDSSGAIDSIPIFAADGTEENNLGDHAKENPSPSETESGSQSCKNEDFAIWQRIIRLDAVRANAEWIIYPPSQAAVSEIKAHRYPKVQADERIFWVRSHLRDASSHHPEFHRMRPIPSWSALSIGGRLVVGQSYQLRNIAMQVLVDAHHCSVHSSMPRLGSMVVELWFEIEVDFS